MLPNCKRSGLPRKRSRPWCGDDPETMTAVGGPGGPPTLAERIIKVSGGGSSASTLSQMVSGRTGRPVAVDAHPKYASPTAPRSPPRVRAEEPDHARRPRAGRARVTRSTCEGPTAAAHPPPPPAPPSAASPPAIRASRSPLRERTAARRAAAFGIAETRTSRPEPVAPPPPPIAQETSTPPPVPRARRAAVLAVLLVVVGFCLCGPARRLAIRNADRHHSGTPTT